MITFCVRTMVVCLLLASFLIVQADLPLVAQAAVERAAVTGEKCAPHRCCCSREKRESGRCCCTSAPKPGAGPVWRAAGCVGEFPPGDPPTVVKFQVVLPVFVTPVTQYPELPAVAVPQERPASRVAEPPDPPPRILVG